MAASRDRRPALLLRPSQRRQRSKWQREQSKQRAIIIAGVIAILFILAVPAYGYWSNFVAPPRAVILQVDDAKYTLGYMAKYMKGLQDLGLNPDMSSEPFRVLQLLEENELIRLGAYSRDLRATSEEVDQEVRERIIGQSPELANVPEDALDREFNETYKQYLNIINLSESEHRNLSEAAILRDKLTEVLGQEVSSVAKQANISWIVMTSAGEVEVIEGTEDLVDFAGKIQAVERKLADGEAFADLADEYSNDRTTAVNGGEVGWVPEGIYGPLDEVIFSLEPGMNSEAVIFGSTTYFIRVNDADDARSLEPDMIDRLKGIAFQTWLVQERGNHRIQVCFGGGSAGGSCDWQYDWLTKRLLELGRQQV